MRKLSDRLAGEMEWVIMTLGGVLLVAAFLLPAPPTDDRVTLVTVCYGLGLSLIATSITAMLLGDAHAKLRDRRMGLERVIAKRYEVGPEFYSGLIEGARHRVWVQGIGLHRFLSDNRDSLVRLANQGVDVRVLLLSDRHYLNLGNSSASLLAIRALEESESKILTTPPGGNHGCLVEFIEKLNGDSVPKFKVYFGTAASMVFLIDDTLFCGPYLHRRESGLTPTFQFGPGPVYAEIVRHFKMLWSDDRFTAGLPRRAS